MTDPVFNIIAKDPQVQHIARKMQPAAVHEHGAEECEIYRYGRRLQSRHFKLLAGIRIYNNLGLRNNIIAGPAP